MRDGTSIIFCTMIMLITQGFHECQGFRILALFPLPIKSHQIFFGKFMKELISRGHEVYAVSHYPHVGFAQNYHHININGSLPESIGQLPLYKVNRGILAKIKYVLRTCGSEICEHLYKHQSIIDLRNSTLKFDLVISEVYGTDCLLVFAHHFQAPIIGISATDMLPWAAARMGNPDNPAYTPNYFYASGEDMWVYEKLGLLWALFSMKVGYFLYSTAPAEIRAKEFFGNDIPPLEDIVSNTSLLLINSHLSVNLPRPMVPGIVEVGGLHIERPKPLPKALKDIVESSKNGAIYFSMGTVVDVSTIDMSTLYLLLGAFSQLPQTIIWQGVIENITFPNGTYAFPWVEQVDLLCHPNLKAFVTHGGLMSLQEAAYCGVPILGISIYPNHKRNILKYVDNGAGLFIDYDYLTEKGITDALNDLVTNTTYKENAVKLSKIFSDRPMGAMEAAVYWTEYVVRFGGAPQLRSKSADLVWFEYYLIDCLIIWACLLTIGMMMTVGFSYAFQDYIDDVWIINYITQNSINEISQENDKDK